MGQTEARKETQMNEERLHHWQNVFSRDKAAQSEERELFVHREALYRGLRDVTVVSDAADAADETPHIYNIIAELIESQVDASIYPVKVTATKRGNEAKARKIEHRINDIVTRLATPEMIDLAERGVPLQGGCYWQPEWDNSAQSHYTHGGVVLSYRHVQNVIPQAGANDIDEMDHVFLELGQSKETVRRMYGADVSEEAEDEPAARSAFGESEPAEDFVTVRICYYRNADGGIGKFVWCGDRVLYDVEDFEARHLRVCADCGAPEPPDVERDGKDAAAENPLFALFAGKKKAKGKICPACGGNRWRDEVADEETLLYDIVLPDGGVISARHADGTPEKIPYYKPRMLPIVLQKSISAPNQLLGVSDADLIEDQQASINLCEREILKRLQKFGALLSLPDEAEIEADGGLNVVRLENPAKADMVRLQDLQLNISQHLTMKNAIYEEAKNLVGITDSYLGRYDSSAKSGIAKQTSAAQAAGRLASKRAMKAAAWARIYELIFKLLLAYDDDEHDVLYRDDEGNEQYETWSRYEFLTRDADGAWCWDDDYLFACDSSLSLMSDRADLWQQVLADYQSGAYGNPSDPAALIHLWKMREELHYPLAGQTRRYLEAKQREAEEAAAAQARAAAVGMMPETDNTSVVGGDGSPVI